MPIGREDRLHDVVQEGRGARAVDDPVVARQRQRHHRPDAEPVHGNHAIGDRPDRQNASLRRNDDRRERVDLVHPEVADREGRAGDVGRLQLARAGALGQVAPLNGDVAEPPSSALGTTAVTTAFVDRHRQGNVDVWD